MSIQAVSWVLQHSKAKLGARLALIAIANHADASGNNSFPSIPTIAAEAHLSERQVQRAIRTLERQGELRIVEGKGRHGTHLFMIAGMGDNMSPDHLSDGVTNRTSRGDISGQTHVQNVTQTVKGTVREPKGVKSGNGVAAIPDPASLMTQIWNEECAGRGLLKPARAARPARQAICRKRWQEDFAADAVAWRDYCRRVAAAPLLRGENERGWHADLDWVLQASHLTHIMEGRYGDGGGMEGIQQRRRPTEPPPKLNGVPEPGALPSDAAEDAPGGLFGLH